MFTSVVIPVDLLTAAWQLSQSLPHTWEQALVGLKTGTYGATDEDYRLSYADAAHSWASCFHIKT